MDHKIGWKSTSWRPPPRPHPHTHNWPLTRWFLQSPVPLGCPPLEKSTVLWPWNALSIYTHTFSFLSEWGIKVAIILSPQKKFFQTSIWLPIWQLWHQLYIIFRNVKYFHENKLKTKKLWRKILNRLRILYWSK